MQTSANQLKLKEEQGLAFKLRQKEADLERTKNLLEQSETKLKESMEAEQSVGHDSKKTIAVRDQKIEFLKMQLTESKE